MKHLKYIAFIVLCAFALPGNAQEDFIIDYELGTSAHYLDSGKVYYLNFRLPYCSNFELTEIGAHIDASSSSGNVKFALYNNNDSIVWQSGEVPVTGGIDEYVYADIPQGDVVLADMTFYYIAMIGGPNGQYINVKRMINPTNNGVAINYSTSTMGQYTNYMYPNFPNPSGIQIAWYGAVNMVAKGVPAPVTITPNVANLPTLSGECISVTAPTAVASCGGTISATTDDPTEYTQDGTYTINWIYKKGFYYAVEQTQTVIVDDVTAPEAPTLPDLHIDFNSVIEAPTTTDACVGTVNGTTSDATTYTVEGNYVITWTFDDGNGNSVQANQNVSVVESKEDFIIDFDLSDILPHYLSSSIVYYLNFRLPYCSNFSLTEIGAHIDAVSNSGVVKFALYNNNDSIVWQSGEVNVTGGIDEYVYAKIPEGDVVLPDMNFYYIAMIGNPTSGNIAVKRIIEPLNNGVGINYSNSTLGQYTNYSYPDFPEPSGIQIAWYGAVNMVAKGIPEHVTITPNIANLPTVSGECELPSAPTAVASCGGTISATTNDQEKLRKDGTHTINWIYKKGFYYAVEQTQTVIVDDITNPEVPTLPDTCYFCTSVIDTPTTTDACAGTIFGTTTNTEAFKNDGVHAVTWLFDDGNGNSVQAIQNITFNDTTKPDIPVLPSLNGDCSLIIVAPTTTDNCAGTITGTTSDATSFSDTGTYTITWDFDDGNGNTVQASQIVTISDDTPPSITCSNDTTISIQTGNTNYTVTGNIFDPKVSDNCKVDSIVNDFNETHSLNGIELPVGSTTINWTVYDGTTNQSGCSCTITIQETSGINNAQSEALSIYPNPTTGKLFINGTTSTINKIVITDISGKTLVSKNKLNSFNSIDISDFENGVYLVRIYAGDKVLTREIIKK